MALDPPSKPDNVVILSAANVSAASGRAVEGSLQLTERPQLPILPMRGGLRQSKFPNWESFRSFFRFFLDFANVSFDPKHCVASSELRSIGT